jgi:ribosomal protein S18 acetylase RimI-like enzyme
VDGFTEQHNESAQDALTVRAADPADAPAIAGVHVASWERAYRGMIPDEAFARRTVEWRTEMWEEILKGSVDGTAPWVAVAERGGLTIGFVSLGSAEDRGPRTAVITGLYVEPSAWRGGAGTALMDAALAQATARGCADVTLWVLEPNLRARAFYERCGFADDGSREREEGWPVELRLRRAL